jgi:hypothetical protein
MGFFKNLRTKGFVCGFGWKPNAKAPTFIKSQADLMALLGINKPTEKQEEAKAAMAAPEPEPVIRCEALNILNDLKMPIEDWSIKHKKRGDSWFYAAKMKGRKYQLHFSQSYWTRPRQYEVFLRGFSEFSFNDDEKNAISSAFITLQESKNEQSRLEVVKQENEALQKLFPNCGGESAGVEGSD